MNISCKYYRARNLLLPVLAATLINMSAEAQIANPTAVMPGTHHVDVIEDDGNGFSIYRVKPVQRSLTAINFFVNDGPSEVALEGTELNRQISGSARVEAKDGETGLTLKVNHLTPAPGFGPEYLTYVLWAISSDGRAQNLGELDASGRTVTAKASTSFQSFGLIITAEPYFSVAQPSDVVVAQSSPNKHTNGVLQQVNTHYSLLPRGLYANTEGAHSNPNTAKNLNNSTLAILEAENAQRIALMAGAGRYSPDIASEVAQDIVTATTPQNGGDRDGKLSLIFARQATQRAEDARISALHKQAAHELRDAAQQALEAQAQADAARAAQAQAEAERDQALARAAQAQQKAEDTQETASMLRKKLREQLNAILETKETARGLIVNMNGVLFDTGKATLKPKAKLSLIKVATILSLYPSLTLQVEGYTDSTGGEELNQRLSEKRAHTVADFLVANGVSPTNLTAKGFGQSNPVASNSTAAGRAQNRRVNLVVSGSMIGVDPRQQP